MRWKSGCVCSKDERSRAVDDADVARVLLGYCQLVRRTPDEVTAAEVLLYLAGQSNEAAEAEWKAKYGKGSETDG